MGWLYCWKSRGDTFFQWQHSYFSVKHCENWEVQIHVLSKWNMLWEWKLVQRFTFCFIKSCYFDFTIWWRHCESHLFGLKELRYTCTEVSYQKVGLELMATQKCWSELHVGCTMKSKHSTHNNYVHSLTLSAIIVKRRTLVCFF